MPPFSTAKRWIHYHLDRFVSSSPLVQVSTLVLLTGAIVSGWGAVLWWSAPDVAPSDSFWWALSRFADGGTMAADRGRLARLLAVGVTASGALLVSFLTGAFASKLSERIDELRTGRSPVLERDHVVVLGFDAKVPYVARELARSHQRLTLVTLAEGDKSRQEALLRSALRVPGAAVRALCRTGDPRSELALLRVSAARARSILLVPDSALSDEQAVRWTLSTLLALRRVTGPGYAGNIVVDSRRSLHEPLLRLAAEAGLAGPGELPLEIIASDDIIARTLAQSVRHGAVYLVLRELLSFRGSELYLEPVPGALLGTTFEAAHSRVHRGIAVGVMSAGGKHSLAPSPPGPPVLRATDRLIVLERDSGTFVLGPSLPPPSPPRTGEAEAHSFPRTVGVLGYNRSLACLIAELDRVMPEGSRLKVCCPELPPGAEAEVREVARACHRAVVERHSHPPRLIGQPEDAALADVDGIVILGCEDPLDPDGDASALALLLQLRRESRTRGSALTRLVTEVRDPATAHQIVSTLDDFLVSTDVVAMMLAQSAVNPSLTRVYREVLDPGGAEIYVHPRALYAREGPASFGEVMAGARKRAEVAIGYVSPEVSPERAQGGRAVIDELDLVHLNPPRDRMLPANAQVIVLSPPSAPDAPDGRLDRSAPGG